MFAVFCGFDLINWFGCLDWFIIVLLPSFVCLFKVLVCWVGLLFIVIAFSGGCSYNFVVVLLLYLLCLLILSLMNLFVLCFGLWLLVLCDSVV